MAEHGGMLAAAILKVVGQQIGSAIGTQITLQKNFSKDLQKMKMALETVEALLEDAERRSITDAPTRLWLKRLKVAMYAISDMIDEFDADIEEITQPSKQKFSMKSCLAVMLPCLMMGPKIILANKMKATREDLVEITAQHKDFNLSASTSANELDISDIRETSSKINEQIFGRTKERDTILASLSKSMTKEITILPIYGIGGLGKTTLAQMIYSSSQFRDYSCVWIYVSQIFDLKKIGNSIISQLSEKESQCTVMEMVKNSLSKLFAGKNILIVLDDLWEENEEDLVKLKGMLNVGNGSNVVVIVTTRSEVTAMGVSTIQPHNLALLSPGLCWSIIKHKSAFKSRNDKNELKQIGKDIASKCGGVALAAQSLGYVLKPMTSRQWKLMRDSDIWSKSDSKNTSFARVLESLRLSYSVMPAYLKLCFAYCAIFPKGHKIVKDDLIQQWLALGFIEPTDMYTSWELGEIYIKQLLGLSFLRNTKSSLVAGMHLEDATFFTMHDLVHDLARSVLVDEILIPDKQENTDGNNCRYALLDDCSKPLKSSNIRALRFMDCGQIELDGAAFSPAKSLRVLDLGECSVHKLPDSISALKQLRYLNAPRIQATMIPDGITRLSKLIYLNLRRSPKLLALPESIGDIEGLMYLDLSGCSRIEKLPDSVVRLKILVHLDLSHCSCVEGVSVFLGSLIGLQYLNLSYCPNIGELPADLGGLSELRYLNLSFSYLQNCQAAEILGSLNKLEYLNFSPGLYLLKKLPEALCKFIRLKYLNLSGCEDMTELPRLFGDLKNLMHLDLSQCFKLKGVPAALDGLTKLKYLNLARPCYMTEYNHECLLGLLEVIGKLTELCYLNLSSCVSFMFRINEPSSFDIDSLMYRISTLSNLEHLDLSFNHCIRSIAAGSLSKLGKLHTLHFSNCLSLYEISEVIGTIDSLKILYLKNCPAENLPQLSSGAASLPRFVVQAGDGESSSNLALLQPTDPEELEITELENVKTAEEANSINLIGKQALEDLKLEWTRDAERSVDDKMLLDKLVPPSTLKEFRVKGYNSVSFPSWIMDITHYLPNLTKVEMCDMPNCIFLPPLSHLLNLDSIVLRGLENLEELNTSYTGGEECTFHRLDIHDCPKLRIKTLRPRVKYFTISNSDGVLSSWGAYTGASTTSSYPVGNTLHVGQSKLPMHQWTLLRHLPDLTCLEITGCGDLACSPEIIQHLSSLKSLLLEDRDQEELPEWLGELTSLQKLRISGYSGLKELHESMRLLTKLVSLKLDGCSSITSLPHWLGEFTFLRKLKIVQCSGLNELHKSMRQLTYLHYLKLSGCSGITSLPNWLGELTSLHKLEIWSCDSIRSLPEGIQQLSNLQELKIVSCPALKKWCDFEEEKMKLAPDQEKACVLPTSLEKLGIRGCAGISSLPQGIQQLTNLQTLAIGQCPALRKWCESEENKTKLAHIREQHRTELSGSSQAPKFLRKPILYLVVVLMSEKEVDDVHRYCDADKRKGIQFQEFVVLLCLMYLFFGPNVTGQVSMRSCVCIYSRRKQCEFATVGSLQWGISNTALTNLSTISGSAAGFSAGVFFASA